MTSQKPIRLLENELLQVHQQSLCSVEKSSNKHMIAEILEEVCHQIYQETNGEDMQRSVTQSKHNELDQVKMQLLQMKAKAFIDQIYINRKYNCNDGADSKSKQFLEAAEILKLNMDLFLKLLRDPFALFVKNINSLQFLPTDNGRTKLFLESKSSECQSIDMGDSQDLETDMRTQKTDAKDHSWKKPEYGSGCSPKGHASSLSRNRIVILKPESKVKRNAENISCTCSSLQSHQILKNKGQIKRATFMSFKEIKRKFGQAVGQSQKKENGSLLVRNLNGVAHDDKHPLKGTKKGTKIVNTRGTTVLSSDAKRREKQNKPVQSKQASEHLNVPFTETKRKKIDSTPSRNSKPQQLDTILLEAKRHLSERLKNVDMGKSLSMERAPRTLKMILSSSDQDMLDSNSPKGHKSRTSAQSGSCSHGNYERAIDSISLDEKVKGESFPTPPNRTEVVSSCSNLRSLDDQKQLLHFHSGIPDNDNIKTQGTEDIGSVPYDLKPSDSAEANEVVLRVNSDILATPCTSMEFGNATNEQINEAKDFFEDSGCRQSLSMDRADNFTLRPMLDSSSPLDIGKLQIIDNIEETEEYRSPVSVLVPFSPEEGSSPTSMISETAEPLLQPRCLYFEDSLCAPSKDPKVETSTCIDGEDSLSVYVRAVVEVSGLNFEEFSVEGTLSRDILRSYIDEGVGSSALEADCDLKLLLDCVHEVIVGVYQCYFGYAPWVPLSQKMRPIPSKEKFIDEVIKEVNFYLPSKMEQPTLDQLASTDMAKSSSWLDLRNDTEDILIQLAEDVLQDSIVDTMLHVQI